MKTQTLTPPPLPANAAAAAANDWLLALDPRPVALTAALRGRMPSQEFTTPQRLWVAVVLLCLGALALWAACAGALNGARAGLKSVGRETAPSILAAGHLRAALADLDGNLVNTLLADPRSDPARRAGAAVTERRAELAENLVLAAENITFGDLERRPLMTLAENVPAHEATLARAQSALERGDLPAALAAERDAADGLRLFLQPAAVLLEYNNATALDRAYAEARAGGRRGVAAVLGVGGALVAALAAFQVWLFRRTRRLLNPGLLAATALAGFLTLWTSVALVRAGGRLRAGTEDAFGSVRFLWQARALAYSINGEESRWLFDRDPARAAASEKAFLDGAARIAWRVPDSGRPAGEFVKALGIELTRDGLRWPADPGYLERELANVTYPGEREAVEKAAALFEQYFAVDWRIRELENSGRHAEAVALCLSYAPNGSNGAFDKFDDALSRLLEINGREFDLAIASGFNALGGLDALAPVFALAVAGLGVAGLWPRLREYVS